MPTSTEQFIASTTLSSAAANITFSGIANSWTDLRLTLVTAPGAATYYLQLLANNDSTASYSRTQLYGNGALALSSRSTSDNFALIGYMDTTYPTFQEVNIFSYAGSTYKTFLTTSAQDKNGSGQIYKFVNLWQKTNAITSLQILPQSGSLSAGTTATLYGIL